jgi:uncharacterized phage-associated protein
MNSPFNLPKATEATLQFMQREHGRINIMKLIKLIYLLDRLSIDRRGMPVVGGTYFSMRNGPVTSELLDIINAGRLSGEEDLRWDRSVSNRENHEIAIRETANMEQETLSDFELGLIDEIYALHGMKTQWQLRDWCHERCAEWTPLTNGRESIAIENIAESLGCSDEEIARIKDEALEANLLAAAFAQA